MYDKWKTSGTLQEMTQKSQILEVTWSLFLPQDTIDKLHPLPSILNQITESLGPEAQRIIVKKYVDGLCLLDLSVTWDVLQTVVRCHLSGLFFAVKWDKSSHVMFLLKTWASTVLSNHPSSSFLRTPKAYEKGMMSICLLLGSAIIAIWMSVITKAIFDFPWTPWLHIMYQWSCAAIPW